MTEHVFDAVAAAPDVDRSVLVHPTALVRRTLPVHPALGPLCPDGGLVRGAAVSVTGSVSLALALVGAASQAGSWVALVGMGGVGVAALGECGVATERVLLVDHVPAAHLPRVLATLTSAIDVVVVGGLGSSAPRMGRRLATVVRERSAVVVTVDGHMPGFDPLLRLEVAEVQWEGLGRGHGHLRRRRMVVERAGRGRAARPVRHAVWLPGVDGNLASAEADGATVVPWPR